MPGKLFSRDENGMILDFRGMNTVSPPDRLPQSKVWYAKNVRRYLAGGTIARAQQTTPLISMDSAGQIHSVRRMNDTTPAGPVSGYVIISGQGTVLRANSTGIAAGLSGKKISIVPFRPNQSVQPWAYVADDNKMLKVRSDGTCYKDGIEEPQVPPTVVFAGGGGTVVPGINGITYRYVYRSSATGALSNASPVSNVGTNTQSSSSGSISGSALTTKATFNGTQWEFVASQLRTTGSATNNAQLLDYVIGRNFGISVPAGVDIDGVVVDLEWANQGGFPAGSLVNVGLFYNGNAIGTIKQPGTVSNSTLTHTTQGNTADTWGATLTPDIVNDASFGFGVQLFENKGRLFINSLTITVYYSTQNASLGPTASTDPQVDKIDWYRFGKGLENYTYVGTSPNGSSSPFIDTLDDLIAQANPILETDNFEPYPSIDLPRKGVVNASSQVATWVSGDQFNVRWLPGTALVVGGVSYILDRRPSSVTSMFVLGLPDGSALAYEIQQPILAQQPMRSQWGPTDNVAFMFACGDSLRPGTLYFTKGNNPDSAPDTNQIEVTSPSEPLQGGCIVSGLSMVFSTERAWLAMPNFFDALATVTGTQGNPFTLQLSISNRGLFARKGLCTDGGANAFFIGKDGIYISPGGNGSKSITDADLYNIFPHESTVTGAPPTIPQDIIFGATNQRISVPDFTNPDAMELSFSNGYLYFDYKDASGNNHTLVYDTYAGGWTQDIYADPVTVHATEEGRVEGVLIGCNQVIRELSLNGVETGQSQVLLPSQNGGDPRALKRWGDAFLEASIGATKSVTIALYDQLYNNQVVPVPAVVSAGTMDTPRTPYIIDFDSQGQGLLAVDVAASLRWDLSKVTTVFTWQPTLVHQPENTENRPTDFDDAGTPAAKFVQGALLTANTFNNAKSIRVQRGDDLAFFTPNESPIIFNGQSSKPITFTPPFVAHNMRIITTDGVPWEMWGVQWIFEPFPESTVEWQSESVSHGLKGWQHIFMLNIPHISTADITITLVFDQGPVASLSLTVPNSNGAFIKTKVVVPSNKFKLVSYRASSNAPFRLFLPDVETHVKEWGSNGQYQIVRPFGGPSSIGAQV